MKAEVRYALVLEAVAKKERTQWAIGSALLKTIPDDDDTVVVRCIDECAEMLISKGYNYKKSSLLHLRRAARMFPPSRRHDDISFEVHKSAGSPENLDRLIVIFKKAGRPMTQDAVRDAMAEWTAREKKHREEALERANIDLEAAKFRKKQAAETEISTVDPVKREAARKAKAAAEADEAEAQERRSVNKVAPRRGDTKTTKPPEMTALDVLSRAQIVCEHAHKMRNALRRDIKTIDDMIHLLEPESRQKIVASMEEVDAQLKLLLSRFQVSGRRLRTIEGGAA